MATPPPSEAYKLAILRQQLLDKIQQDKQYTQETDRQYTGAIQPNPNWVPKKSDGGYISALARDMSNPEYRAQLESQEALENVYPEAYLAPLARSIASSAKAMFAPQARKVVSNPIGWKIRVPSKENLGEYTMPPPAVFVPRNPQEIARQSFKKIPEKLAETMMDNAPRVAATSANDLLNWANSREKQNKAHGGRVTHAHHLEIEERPL